MPGAPAITYADFDKVDIRVGRVVSAETFPEARKPAYKLLIDFGPDIGTRTSSAQLTRHYTIRDLEGRLVVAVVNFPPRQIGPFLVASAHARRARRRRRGRLAGTGQKSTHRRTSLLTQLDSQDAINFRAVTGGSACSAYATRTVLVCLIAIATASTSGFAQGGPGAQGGRRPGGDQITSIDERNERHEEDRRLLPALSGTKAAGRLWLEIPKLDTEVLYSTGLATGLGSNDIGLDRGILTGSRIVKFERAGPRVLMVQPNYQFRALTTNAAEARTVRDAFARSVLWGFTIAAASGDRLLVDFTEYLVRDGNDMAARLRPGSYRFDATRSSIYTPMTLGFPKNTEMEAELTFVRNAGAAGGGPGGGRGRRWRRRWRWRRVLRGRRQRRGDRRSREHPRAPLHRRAARRELQAAAVRSAIGLRQHGLTRTTRRCRVSR